MFIQGNLKAYKKLEKYLIFAVVLAVLFSQVPLIYAIFCKSLNLMNILQHCPSFYHRTCPWLPEQHLKDLGSAIWYKCETMFTRIIFVLLTICYVARACLGKAIESLA